MKSNLNKEKAKLNQTEIKQEEAIKKINREMTNLKHEYESTKSSVLDFIIDNFDENINEIEMQEMEELDEGEEFRLNDDEDLERLDNSQESVSESSADNESSSQYDN